MTDSSISQPSTLVSKARGPTTEISTENEHIRAKTAWSEAIFDDAVPTNSGSSLSGIMQYPSQQRDSGVPDSSGLVQNLQEGPTEDDIVEALRGGLDKCLEVFFGTRDRTGKDDMVQPQAGHWSQCRFSEFCDCMTRISLPKGTAADPEERELDLLYNILYAVFMHLLQGHPDRRRVIREIRYRMTDVTMQRNKRILQVKRAHDKEIGAEET